MENSQQNRETVTSPPPLSSAVLSERYRAKLPSEQVLHKLLHDLCHGLETSVRGSYIKSIEIFRGGGCR